MGKGGEDWAWTWTWTCAWVGVEGVRSGVGVGVGKGVVEEDADAREKGKRGTWNRSRVALPLGDCAALPDDESGRVSLVLEL